MKSGPSYRSVERAGKTIEAAQVLKANAAAIARACAGVSREDVILAVVSPALDFMEPLVTPLSQLGVSVGSLDPYSWHLVFSPDVGVEEVERRCTDMGELAALRLDALRRWLSKQQESGG